MANKQTKTEKMSKNLLTSQILFFKDNLEKKGGKLVFIHKYLLMIDFSGEKFYVKINLTDNEFYLFSKEQPIISFYSFEELKLWAKVNFFKEEVSRG